MLYTLVPKLLLGNARVFEALLRRANKATPSRRGVAGAPPSNSGVHHVPAVRTFSARRFRPCNTRWMVMMIKSEK